jgi:hypothetical protein
MYNPLRGGTADVWYSGFGGDLWDEYKWLAQLPKRVPIRMYNELSPLQLRWVSERYEEGRNVCVMLGSPEGCWIFVDGAWERDLDPQLVRNAGLTKHDMAEYIKSEVCQC